MITSYKRTNQEFATEPLKTADDAAGAESSIFRLDMTTRLAFERTRLAYDNTVMAAVRTATSLITFGFTVYKFFELEIPGRVYPARLAGPHAVGITMIVIGLVSLLLTTANIVGIARRCGSTILTWLALVQGMVAAQIAAVGILALFAAILKQ